MLARCRDRQCDPLTNRGSTKRAARAVRATLARAAARGSLLQHCVTDALRLDSGRRGPVDLFFRWAEGRDGRTRFGQHRCLSPEGSGSPRRTSDRRERERDAMSRSRPPVESVTQQGVVSHTLLGNPEPRSDSLVRAMQGVLCLAGVVLELAGQSERVEIGDRPSRRRAGGPRGAARASDPRASDRAHDRTLRSL